MAAMARSAGARPERHLALRLSGRRGVGGATPGASTGAERVFCGGVAGNFHGKRGIEAGKNG